ETMMLTTVDGRCWTEANGLIPADIEATCAAIAPELGIPAANAFRIFYVGLRKHTAAGTTEARIMHRNATGTWASVSSNTTGSEIPALSPNAIAVDDFDALKAFAAFGGGSGGEGAVCVTQDGGVTWTKLTPGAFPNSLPPTPVTGVVIDPYN